VSVMSLAIGALVLGVMLLGNRLGVRNPWFYAFFGIGGLWTAFLLSGVHATIAGVLAAFTIPAVPKLREDLFVRRMRMYLVRFAGRSLPEKGVRSSEQMLDLGSMTRLSAYAATPLQQLERALHPLVTYVVLPLFALANAGVELPGDMASAFTAPVTLG